MYEFQFKGNKPSEAQVLKEVKKAIQQGYSKIEISWGENMVEFEKFNSKWVGFGWIKNISGQDLANML